MFDGLLSDKNHDKLVSGLLFTYCLWHCLAKLRLHTESTVHSLKVTTTDLGHITRLFREETLVYDTRELQKEVAARGRRQAALVKKDGNNSTQTGPKQKILNINTPKIHVLGYYASAIRNVGTTDNVSTQIGSFLFLRQVLPLIILYRANLSTSGSKKCSVGQISEMQRETSVN